MIANDRFQYSDYPRDGYMLDVGRLWEISTGSDTLRDLCVFANAHGIRIRDMKCGEWEDSERHAIHLTPDVARKLGEILLEAAQQMESNADHWRRHGRQADPRPALWDAIDDKLRRLSAGLGGSGSTR